MIKTDGDLLNTLRQRLVPQGTAPVVRLHFGTYNNFFKKPFVDSCLDALEARIASGETLNSLEHFAVALLMDSAYIERKEIDVPEKK